MGYVFPGVSLGKHWLHAFLLAEVPSEQVCGKLPESRLLWLPKEPREGPFVSTKPSSSAPGSSYSRPKHSPLYIAPPPQSLHPNPRTHGLQHLKVLPLWIHLDPLFPPGLTFTHLAPDALQGVLPPSWCPRLPAGTGTSQKCPLLPALGQPPAGSHLNSQWVL